MASRVEPWLLMFCVDCVRDWRRCLRSSCSICDGYLGGVRIVLLTWLGKY